MHNDANSPGVSVMYESAPDSLQQCTVVLQQHPRHTTRTEALPRTLSHTHRLRYACCRFLAVSSLPFVP
jgi:hypothetical protein